MSEATNQAIGRRRYPARLVLACAFVAAQVVMLGVAHTTDLRYFTWAPHDQQAAYEIEVVIGGVALSDDQVHDRYRISRGVDPRAASHVIRVVEQYESTYGEGDDAEVLVRLSVNGGEVEEWRWPRP